MVESGDAVVGMIERGRLSSALTTIHRGGQGHNARVLDGARSDLQGQLRRAGVTTDLDLENRGRDTVLILIHAPGRIAKATELLHRAGANVVHVVERAGADVPRPFSAPPVASERAKLVVASDVASD